MNFDEAEALTEKYGQGHLLEYYGELDTAGRERLLSDIAKIDFEEVFGALGTVWTRGEGVITPMRTLSLGDIERNRDVYREEGIRALSSHEVGAVLLAGGMGTRLGAPCPKGMFNIGETREVSLFELQMETVMGVARECGTCFPMFIMTSSKNGAETERYFRSMNYFGYDPGMIHFYVQDEMPALSPDGKIYLEEKDRVFFSPNGNGGWYRSLVNAGMKPVLEKYGVKWLNVYSVDNPLQKIFDPVFVGATSLSGCACGAKVVEKAAPDEKVGVICEKDGSPMVIEYYEMSPEMARETDADGKLRYRYGVILNYLFDVGTLDRCVDRYLPYHTVKKAVPHIENGKKICPKDACGTKLETLVVDMVALMGSCLGFEVERDREFAPVKNSEGCDSVMTARELLKKNGVIL